MTDMSHLASAHDTQSTVRYHGSTVGIAGNIVHGWAIDAEEPDAYVVLEILVDGEPAGITLANQFQTNGDETGNEFHGFSFALSESAMRNAESVSVRVANHAVVLGRPLQLSRQDASIPVVGTSQLWYHGGLVISGWLWNPASPGKQLTLQVRHGQHIIMKTVADQPHQALVWMQSSEHGFQIELPIEFADGKSREIHIETDTGQNLPGSPLTVCCHAEGLSTVIHKLWPASVQHDPLAKKKLDALTTLVHAQERFNPISVGFSQYSNWFAISEKAQCPTSANTSSLRAAVIILGGEGPDLDRSMDSLSAQSQLPAALAHHAGDLRAAILRAAAEGADLIIGLEAGDRLAPSFITRMSEAFDSPEVICAYGDCDQDGADGERTNPWLKPAWDADLFFGVDIVTPGSAWSAQHLCAVLNAYPDVRISDWQTVSVLAAETTFLRPGQETKLVRHVPAVLYHRRASAPADPYDVAVRSANCLKLLEQLAQSQDRRASISAVPQYPGITRVKWSLPKVVPSVSLIVPTRDHYRLLHACIEGILNRTDYPGRVEVIVVDNNSTDVETLRYMESLERQGVRILRYAREFNYSDINNFAVSHATADLVGLVNNDIEVIHEDWLTEMVAQLCRPNVGAVGAKLLWPNNMVQHGGVVVGIAGLAAHTGNTWHDHDAGYLGINQLVRRQSAVTAACLILRRRDYEAIGGLDGMRFPVAFNDVDLCLRLREKGLNIIWTPHAKLIHAESASRGKEDTPAKAARASREQNHFKNKWAHSYLTDEFYHPGLTKSWAVGPYNALALP